MNIFILDLDPEKCARYHCNKHLVKMITEHNQILGSIAYTARGVHRKADITTEFIQKTFRGNTARKNLTRKKQAVTKIQSRLRGNRSRTGKSERWGLPFPKSRRDVDFDPFLKSRVYNERLSGRREGILGV